MGSQHTPGQWVVFAPTGGNTIPIRDAEGGAIAQVWGCNDEARDNAALIAMAPAIPALVSALRGMVGLLTLIGARADVTDDLRLAITTSHRVKAAAEALELAGDFQPDEAVA